MKRKRSNYDKARAVENRFWGLMPARSEKRDMLEDNGKAGLAVGLAFRTCLPTAPCAKHCYAARRALNRRACLRKAIQVTKAILADPLGAADRIVEEFRRRAPRRGATFLRWNSSGDLFPEAVKCILAVARQGIIVHVFTRKPRLGARLRRKAIDCGAPVVVLCSCDRENVRRVRRTAPDCRVAVLTSAENPADFRELNPARTVAFPADGHPRNIATVPEEFRSTACPCDMGERHFQDSCSRCLADGSGCFMGL